MRIIVKAKTKSKKVGVERVNQPVLDFDVQKNTKTELITYKVSVKEAPVSGQANEAIIRALAEYFDIAKTNITLISGQTSKQKLFEIS